MSYVRWLKEIRIDEKSSVGEKAAGLGELIHAGFDVPRGVCITADAYRDTFATNRLSEKIAARLDAIDVGNPIELEPAAEEIRNWIENASVGAEIEERVQTALDALASELFVVRVSRVSEDVPNPSATGLPQAYLALPRAQILDDARKCWSTPWNSRAIYFRFRKKISHDRVLTAVVVQPMMPADSGGVLFTANPLTGNANEIHIDATWGLGEAVTAARWKPDHFVVEKNSGAIRERAVTSKSVMNIVGTEGGVETIGVAGEKQDAPCLTDEQLIALARLGEKVEAHFKSAQDIEWCCLGEKIFLLQTRALKK